MRGPLIVIPCLNEERHLPALLRQMRQDAPAGSRIVVVDGGSHDRSRQQVAEAARIDRRVQLLDNPARLQSAGVNAAVRAFAEQHDWLVRVDAHGQYPADFARRLIAIGEAQGVSSVVVPLVTTPDTSGWFQAATAAAMNSRLGTGGSAHRHTSYAGEVEHGHHALMSIKAFMGVGGYDESFSHNEDAELDLRLTRAGHRLWLAPDLAVDYHPRRRAVALWRQYVGYGRGRMRTLLKHRAPPRLRQMLPLAVLPAGLLAIAGCVVAGLWGSFALVLLAPLAAYLVLVAAVAIRLAITTRSGMGLAAAAPAILMHLGWSVGAWSQLLRAERERASRPGQGSRANGRGATEAQVSEAAS